MSTQAPQCMNVYAMVLSLKSCSQYQGSHMSRIFKHWRSY